MATDPAVVALISAFSALAGVTVNWWLSKITADQSRKAASRAEEQKLISQHYLDVMSSMEMFFRSKIRGGDMDAELSRLKAIVDLFGDQQVREAFDLLTTSINAYSKLIQKNQIKYVRIKDGRDDFPDDWKAMVHASNYFSEEMRSHLSALKE